MIRKLKKILLVHSEVLLRIVIIGVAGLLVMLVYIPKVGQLITKVSSYNNERIRATSLQNKLNALRSMSETDIQSLYSIAESSLPSEKNFPTILIAIDNLAQRTNFTLDDVSFVPGIVSTDSAVAKEGESSTRTSATEQIKETDAGALALMVAVKGRGNTAQFDDFVKGIQEIRRLFDIESVKASYFTDVDDLLQADFLLRAYYLPPVTEIGSVESELPEFTVENQEILAFLESYPDMNFVQSDMGTGEEVPLGKTNLFE